MKEFTVIVRNKNTGKLLSKVIKAENFMKAIGICLRKLPNGSNHEYMYHKEVLPKGKK
jgi:hypothetical protein